MVDHIVDATAPRGRVEIRSGVGRRRRWSEEDKRRIVAESYAPGAVVSEIARRHEISPQHLFAWRKAARRCLKVLTGRVSGLDGNDCLDLADIQFSGQLQMSYTANAEGTGAP